MNGLLFVPRAARLAWLWPLLGIIGEVVFLVVVIGIYEVRRHWFKQRETPAEESRPLDQQPQQHSEDALHHPDADAAAEQPTDIRLRTLKG